MKPRIAIVCDWLTNPGGAERVIHAFHELYPEAPIFTTVFNKERVKEFPETVINTSFLQKVPFAVKKHQLFLPLMPLAFEQFDLSNYDVVISSCHSTSKGIITKPRTLHISYLHSPMRYAWDNSQKYFDNYRVPRILRPFARRSLHKIRIWDRLASDRVDHFITNSEYVRKRVKKYYQRDADVIYPPVSIDQFSCSTKKGKYYLAVGRLTPYKRFDLLVETFNELRKPLLIVGSGRDEAKLKQMAKQNIQFLGEIPDSDLIEVYSEAKALLFPQVEDFGITPLEAMSSGKPVIALSEGGALETVVPGETGLFFDKQSVFSIKKAIEEFEDMKWDSSKIREHAESFKKERFQKEIENFVNEKWEEWKKTMV
jgi:glycosyltransferase involved in cell wall biosynthesis